MWLPLAQTEAMPSQPLRPYFELQTSTRMYDYKAVGGIMMPHRVVMSMMGIQQVVTLVETAPGDQDAALFTLPPAIRALKGNP